MVPRAPQVCNAGPFRQRQQGEPGIQFSALDIALACSLFLLIPYFGWGIYTLRKRYTHHEELNPAVEALTLAGLVVFYTAELALLRSWLGPLNEYFYLSALGLFVSGAALYGHMLLSLLSRLVVGAFMPAGKRQVHEPRYGAAEARERQGDFEGAVAEHQAVARAFPRDPISAIRIGDNLARLGRLEEAAAWFEAGLLRMGSPGKELSVAFRLCDLYSRDLEQPDEAVRVLEEFVARHPEAEHTETALRRLERIKGKAAPRKASHV